MSSVIKQTCCPNCPSSDAYTLYVDGSSFCFSCHYHTSAERSISLIKELLTTKINKSNNEVQLPEDCTSYIPPEPLAWIKQYGITNDEIRNYRFLWSKEKQALIFPVFKKDGTLTFWQGRFFPRRNPKSITCGKNKTYLCGGLESQPNNKKKLYMGFVEDIISAIKVSREIPAACLFGSYISTEIILKAAEETSRCILWLDNDKSKEMIKYQQRYGYLFKDGISIIRTEKDPKECSMKLIREKLNEAIKAR